MRDQNVYRKEAERARQSEQPLQVVLEHSLR
jgi:hypothetical protein